MIRLFFISYSILFLLTGCSGWKSNTYKSTASVAITADTAMKIWADYVATGKATDAQQVQVRSAYQKYQASMLAVIDAGKASTAVSPYMLDAIVSSAAIAQTDLINIINAFVPKKLTP